ncbi:hypothetical protein L0U88_19540 [Flavihumibacter sp. RY-1]|uniref:DUF423 domain-containing protein n=1 Tax=Flavihumibacter fluminis TaxID=2909236 RepID=A0ABS9BND1_9BACT|nr:hypothetical protein [Flavihumibacter fluminis]MCF1716845.1 hypothetical protein [Flavihumibacter fluminis]
MKIINRLIILTVVFNFLILIGAGHGIGFLGLIEIIGFKEFFQGDTKFSLTDNYNDRLFLSAALALVGQIILIIAYFQKQQIQKFRVIYAGLFILFFSFIILTKNILNSSLDSFSFWSGTPFLLLAISLLVCTRKNHKLTLE